MKKYIFILAFIVLALKSNAQIQFVSFNIDPQFVENSGLKVPNIHLPTGFNFSFSFTRSIASGGGFTSGNCVVSLIYTEYQSGDGSIQPDPSEVKLYEKELTSSDYKEETAFVKADAIFTGNKVNGKIVLRYVYTEFPNQVITKYSSTRYGINTSPTPDPTDTRITRNEGDILTFADDGRILIVMDGRLRHIQSMDTYLALFVRSTVPIRTYLDVTKNPMGSPIQPGTRIVDDLSNGMVYFNEGNVLRYITSPSVASRYKFNFKGIQHINGTAGYIIGPPIY
ncbi:hypothetical protein EZ456_08235 [Pedobacter psychrodurus]|uniref:Uncharacterized protein n=1 Tax=Pedobacter psychrodurus TaxID=2530456 RepID=A0A4R0Q8F3_9SPHI|nr:hypothetical protein [Pedobacter psychrodurus]TCD27926.1 hypothetical protein EZ456_08235 [Pedobacter psychrodurus]